MTLPAMTASRRLAAVAGILLSAWMAALSPAGAQEGEIRALNERVDDLEQSVRSITKYLSNNDAPEGDFQSNAQASAPGGASDARLADLVVRMQQIESSLRDLTGQVEEAMHRIDRLSKRLDKLAKDVEFRFQQLESGGTGQSSETTDAPSFGAGAAPTGDSASQEDTATAEAKADDEEGADQQTTGDGDGQQAGGQPLPSGQPAELYDKALGLLRQENYSAAAKTFQSFLTQYPDNQLAANAQYWLGESYYARGQHAEAARAFLKTYETYPKSSKASGALLKLGLSLAELDQTQDACAALREFDRRFPDAEAVAANRAAKARKSLNCP